MQTLWWLHNEILRHIHKKRFSVFWSSRFLRICNQILKGVLVWPKKNFFSKKQRRCQTMQNFMLILKPLKKFWKNAPKKAISKNVSYKCTFFTFTHVRQISFAHNFFSLHNNFFNGFEISVEFCVFWHLFWYNFFLGDISIFSNFEAKAQKTAQKI